MENTVRACHSLGELDKETHHSHSQECSDAGVHNPTVAGISGSKGGAFSIVMSAAYEDADDGDTLCVFHLLLHPSVT